MNPSTTTALARPIDLYAEGVRENRRHSRAQTTLDAYECDWRMFADWCGRLDEQPLPATPKLVYTYITYLAAPHEVQRTYQTLNGPRTITQMVSCKYATIQRALITIGICHKRIGLPNPAADPAVREVLAGVRRKIGIKPSKKTALLTGDLKTIFMGRTRSDQPIDIRDRAILLLGFAGGFRRSELAALDVADLAFRPEGLVINLRRSKTDQEGKGREVAVFRGGAMCPVRAVERWLDVVGAGASGSLFRPFRGSVVQAGRMRPRVIARIVKRHAEAIGKDPGEFAGHSLRRGFVTQAIRAGAAEREIMRTTGHKSSDMIREYIEESRNPFDENASGRLGL